MLMSTRAAVMPAKAGAQTRRSLKLNCSAGKPSPITVRAAKLPSMKPAVFVGKDEAAMGINARVTGKVSAANVPGEIVVNAAAADGACLVCMIRLI